MPAPRQDLSIPLSGHPWSPGLEHEEPELAYEADLPESEPHPEPQEPGLAPEEPRPGGSDQPASPPSSGTSTP